MKPSLLRHLPDSPRRGVAWLLCAGATACATGSDVPLQNSGQVAGGDVGSGAGDGDGVASGAGADGSSDATSVATGPGATGPGATGPGATAASVGSGASASSGGGGPGSGGSGALGGDGSGGAAEPAPSKVVFMAGGGSSLIGWYNDLVAMTSWATLVFDQTFEPLSIGTTPGKAYAVYRAADGGEIRYTTWTSQNWSPAQPMDQGVAAASPPTVFAEGNVLHVAYEGTDGVAYYAANQSGLWIPTEEPIVGPGEVPLLVAAPPAIAVLGAEVVVLSVGDDGDLHHQSRVGGQWQPSAAHGLSTVATVAPQLVALDAGAELLAVFADSASGALRWTSRTGGVWSAAADIPGVQSLDAPSVAALEGGDALLAFRGSDGVAYATRYNGVWSAPEPVASPPPAVPCPPRVTRGAVGAEAELAWVDVIGGVYWTRLVSGAWTASAFSGSAGIPSCVAIGTVP